MTVPEPTPAACRARRRGPHKPPLPAWALRDLRNQGQAALTLAARADLKAGAGTEQTVTVPPPKSASTTPPAFASALRPGKPPGRIAWSLAWPGSSAGAYAVVGAAAMLGAAMQAPLTGLALMLELTSGGFGILLPMVAATVTGTMVARQVDGYSIYTARLRAR